MLIHLTLYLGVLVVAGAALTEVEQLHQKVEQLQESVEQLIQQMQRQQLYMEERARSEGVSGIKQARVVTHGTKPYFATSVTVQQVAAIHSHGNGNATAGMGEFIAVLNGVEFRTRHNDYALVQSEEMRENMSHIEYNKVRPITYPEVPPEVTNKATIKEQIKEMRAWFKAWMDQNHKVRDYRKYFKPILCYLEGGWTFSDRDTIEEPFQSHRHHLDAKSWKDLEDKIIFTSSSGKKNRLENFASLPTSYFTTDNGTSIGQWNYRILCHPLKKDLPLKQLDVIDDVAARMAFGYTLEEYKKTRAARFSVEAEDKKDQFTHFTLLDKLMGEIPGKDGYGNELTDETLEGDVINDYVTLKPQKAGYYNRMFKSVTDAMGSDAQYRTFSGETTFMALTTQDKIVPTGYEKCEGKGENQTCSTFRQRWTYAIPLEIIYLTPLQTWNPYDIEYKGDSTSDYGASVRGVNKKRNGSRAKPFNGTNSELFYKTPSEFFDQDNSLGGRGDTGTKSIYVLDRNGTAHRVVASGIRIHLPEIKGVGELRIRYPIMPFYYEGSPAWKELASLRDMIMDSKAHSRMFKTKPNFAPQDNNSQGKQPQRQTTVTIILRGAAGRGVGEHQHLIQITSEALDNLRKNPGSKLQVTTTQANGHTHDLTITAQTRTRFRYTECDGKPRCWDGHPNSLTLKIF